MWDIPHCINIAHQKNDYVWINSVCIAQFYNIYIFIYIHSHSFFHSAIWFANLHFCFTIWYNRAISIHWHYHATSCNYIHIDTYIYTYAYIPMHMHHYIGYIKCELHTGSGVWFPAGSLRDYCNSFQLSSTTRPLHFHSLKALLTCFKVFSLTLLNTGIPTVQY